MLKSPVLVAHQPEYFPWLGFIAKAQLADVYYIVDTVQYMKEHWHSRNKIRKKDGWLWINTPVLQSKSKILMWPSGVGCPKKCPCSRALARAPMLLCALVLLECMAWC